MMKRIISLFSIVVIMLTLTATSLFAQGSDSFMRSNGKFYVVVGVIITIFIGLIIFMTMVERRISKLEREVEE